MSGFKFDFSPPVKGRNEAIYTGSDTREKLATSTAQVQTMKANADELIEKLLVRTETSANGCMLVNSLSKTFSTSNSKTDAWNRDDSYDGENGSFVPEGD